MNQVYDLYDFDPAGLQWTHSEFTIFTVPIAHTLCGDLTYEATFMSQAIDSVAQPMSYDPASHSFAFYSEDYNLIGSQEFTIQAFLTNFPTVVTAVESAFI